MKIEEAIQQQHFQSEFHKAQINLLFTASWMQQLAGHTLKDLHISWQQFNILRILKGRYPQPATVTLLGERMIDKMSNASRLVEKLRKKGLVSRNICPNDRRRADVSITPKGLAILKNASLIMEQEMKKTFGTVSEAEAKVLNKILDKIREEDGL
jgi:DNA-binding MarR family transcriptional regulator